MIDSHKNGNVDNRSPSNISRRSVLQGLGGGVSIVGISGVVASDEGSEDMVEVPRTIRAREGKENEIVRTREVPWGWHNHIKKARRVAQKTKEDFKNEEGVFGVGRRAHGNRIGKYQKHAVVVKVKDENIDRKIPDERDGIPIIIEKDISELVPQSHGSCSEAHNYTQDYDPVKGGVVIEDSYDAVDTCDNLGTTCCRVSIVGDNSSYILTARHIWGCKAGDWTGKSAYQHGDSFGTVSKQATKHDAVLIELNSNGARSGLSAEIVDESDSISGFESQWEVEALASNGTPVHRRGVNDGKEQQTVKDVGFSHAGCGYQMEHFISYNNTPEDGDSGGPIYQKYSDHLSLVGMHNYRDSYTEGWGASAYGMNQTHNIQFG